MSSFRPEVETPPPVFVPQALAGGMVDGARNPAAPVFAAVDVDGEPEMPSGDESAAEGAALDPEALAAIAALEAEAFDRGHAAGLAEARAIDAALAAIEDAARRLAVAAAGDVATNRTALIELAGEIARRWVGAELETSPQALEAGLAQAVERLGDVSAVTIRLARADMERLDAVRPEWRASLGARGAIVFMEDDTLGAGAFELQAEAASIEARTKAILADLMDHLAPAIAADAPELTASDDDSPEAAVFAEPQDDGEDA